MSQVTVKSKGTVYEMVLSARDFTWTADEPFEKGGGNQGPTPYELLLASVGACTAITAQMYAARKEWPLTRVDVTLGHSRIPAEEYPESATRSGTVTEIRMGLRLSGPLTDQQRARILEIAGRCPVKRTLEGEIKVLSTLVSAEAASETT